MIERFFVMTKSKAMDEQEKKSNRVYSTITLSKVHKKRLEKFCKQQKLDQKSVSEYLVDYAIFHDLNVHVSLPKNKQLNPVSVQDLNALKEELKSEWLKFSRRLSSWESERDELIKSMDARYADMAKRKDDQYRQMTRQWNDQVVKTMELQQVLDQITGQKK